MAGLGVGGEDHMVNGDAPDVVNLKLVRPAVAKNAFEAPAH